MRAWFAVIFVAPVALAYLYVALVGGRGSKQTEVVRKEVRKVEVVAARAAAAVERLVDDRRLIERKAEELELLSLEARGGEVGFQPLVQRHNESRLLADSWYDHKKQATDSRTELARGVAMLQWRIGQLRGEGRRSAAVVTTTQASADQLGGVVSKLQKEITLSGAALDRYNQQTGDLSRHIGTSCGPRGEQWYAALQERQRTRELNRQRR